MELPKDHVCGPPEPLLVPTAQVCLGGGLFVGRGGGSPQGVRLPESPGDPQKCLFSWGCCCSGDVSGRGSVQLRGLPCSALSQRGV